MMACNAAHIGGCVVPPLLLKKKALMNQVERPLLPGRIGKTAILLERFNAVFTMRRGHGPQGVLRKVSLFVQRVVKQAALLARRYGQMGYPVVPGKQPRHG